MNPRKMSVSKSSDLPEDYLKMISDVFHSHFEFGLKLYQQKRKDAFFKAQGAIYTQEICLSVSLVSKGSLAAETVYASCDFDPKASAPTAEELLSACVDAIGSVFNTLLDEKKPDQITELAEGSQEVLDPLPVHWTATEINKREIYIRFDRANPLIETLTEEWLKKNDPTWSESEKKTQKEMENLFFTGPKSPSSSKTSGNDR
ncbi:MAG: hypothetical protein ACO3A2_01870 [Bdellovibrionia bacterium]